MALKIKELQEFARNTKFTYKVVKEVYDYLVDSIRKENVNIDILSGVILQMVQNNLNNVAEYEQYTRRDIKEESNIPELTPEEAKELIHEQMNERVKSNVRIKLGYSKSSWNKVMRYEKMMKDYLGKALPEYLSQMIAQSIKLEDDEAAELFLKFEEKWKTFCRSNIINRYPGSEKQGNTREQILNLFAERVRSILTQPVDEIKQV